MVKKRWLTKEERQLLRPHADHFQKMGVYIHNAAIEDLHKLNNACRACTEVNCGWDQYAAAQYLLKEIDREVGWRNRRDAEAAELAEPTAHILDRLADDGAPVNAEQ